MRTLWDEWGDDYAESEWYDLFHPCSNFLSTNQLQAKLTVEQRPLVANYIKFMVI